MREIINRFKILLEQKEIMELRAGAGILPVALSTKRASIPLRSRHVVEGSTWCLWGGKVDSNEQPKQAAIRELKEESGYSGKIILIPLLINERKDITFFNYLGIIEEEFSPKINWETQDFKWVDFDELLSIEPKHSGLKKLLKDSTSLKIIKKYML